MDQYVEEEFEDFLKEIKNPCFEFGTYFNISSYEDDYGETEIQNAMEVLAEKIKVYLSENHSGKFLVTTGWCVHVMTPERAKKSRISKQTIEDYLVR